MFTRDDIKVLDTPTALANFWGEQNTEGYGQVDGRLVSVNNGEETRYFLIEQIDLTKNGHNQDDMTKLAVKIGLTPSGFGRVSEANEDGTLQSEYNAAHDHAHVKAVGAKDDNFTVDEAVDVLVDFLNGQSLPESWIDPTQH